LCHTQINCADSRKLFHWSSVSIPSVRSLHALERQDRLHPYRCPGERLMNVRLKKLRDQIIVITGASSGIGLVTARMAAERGARLILAARSGEELQRLSEEIESHG